MKHGLKRVWGRGLAGLLTASMLVTGLPVSVAAAPDEGATTTVDYAAQYPIRTDANGNTIDLGGMNITIYDYWTDVYQDSDYVAWAEKTYNFTIQRELGYYYSESISNFAQNAKDAIYVLPNTAMTTELMRRGYFYDLSTLDCLDLTQPKYANNKISKVYSMDRGDYGDGKGVYAMDGKQPIGMLGLYYNKDIVGEITKTDLYALQDQGQWNYETFLNLLESVQNETEYQPLAADKELTLRALMAMYNTGLLTVAQGCALNGADSKEMQLVVEGYNQLRSYCSEENWNWNKYGSETFAEGETAFLLASSDAITYSELLGALENGVNVGFLMFPLSKNQRHDSSKVDGYNVVCNNDITVIPASCDAETAWKLAFAYDVFTGENAAVLPEQEWLLQDGSYESTIVPMSEKIIADYSVYTDTLFWRLLSDEAEVEGIGSLLEELSPYIDLIEEFRFNHGLVQIDDQTSLDLNNAAYYNYDEHVIDPESGKKDVCITVDCSLKTNNKIRTGTDGGVESSLLEDGDYNLTINLENIPDKFLDDIFLILEIGQKAIRSIWEKENIFVINISQIGESYVIHSTDESFRISTGNKQTLSLSSLAKKQLNQYYPQGIPTAKEITLDRDFGLGKTYTKSCRVDLSVLPESNEYFVYKVDDSEITFRQIVTYEEGWGMDRADMWIWFEESGTYLVLSEKIPGVTTMHYDIEVFDPAEGEYFEPNQIITVFVNGENDSRALNDLLLKAFQDERLCTDGRYTNIYLEDAPSELKIDASTITTGLRAARIESHTGEFPSALQFEFYNREYNYDVNIGFRNEEAVKGFGLDIIDFNNKKDFETIGSLMGDTQVAWDTVRANYEFDSTGDNAFVEFGRYYDTLDPSGMIIYRYENGLLEELPNRTWSWEDGDGYRAAFNPNEIGLYVQTLDKAPYTSLKKHRVDVYDEGNEQRIYIDLTGAASQEEAETIIREAIASEDVMHNGYNTTVELTYADPADYALSASLQNDVWNALGYEKNEEGYYSANLAFWSDGIVVRMWNENGATDFNLGMITRCYNGNENWQMVTDFLEQNNVDAGDYRVFTVNGLGEYRDGFAIESFDTIKSEAVEYYIYAWTDNGFEERSKSWGFDNENGVIDAWSNFSQDGIYLLMDHELPASVRQLYNIQTQVFDEERVSQFITFFMDQIADMESLEQTIDKALADPNLLQGDNYVSIDMNIEGQGDWTELTLSKETVEKILKAVGVHPGDTDFTQVAFHFNRMNVSFRTIEAAREISSRDFEEIPYDESEAGKVLSANYEASELPYVQVYRCVGEGRFTDMDYSETALVPEDFEKYYYYRYEDGGFVFIYEMNVESGQCWPVADMAGEYVISSQPLKESLLVPEKYITIFDEPIDQSIYEGDLAVFNVITEGQVQSFQWQKSTDGGKTWYNMAADTAKSDSLQFVAKRSYSGMLIRCKMINGYGEEVYTREASLTVWRSMLFTQHPASQTVSVGETVVFKAVAVGESLTYQWKKSIDGGKSWVNSSSTGSKTNTLKMLAKASFNGYLFKCVITDINGNQHESEAAELTVLKTLLGPSISKQPVNSSVTAGKTATFQVVADGTNLTYQWKKSTDGGKSWVNSSSTGAKTGTLSMTAKISFSGYQFKCVITDANGMTVESNAVTLKVTPAVLGPAIKTQPVDVTCVTGNPALFHVEASGTGLTYQWKKSVDNGATWVNSGSTGAKTDTLSMTAKISFSGYQFKCVVTDADGKKVESNVVTLKVTKASEATLSIKTQPVSVSTSVGQMISFNTQAIGDGLTYQWMKSSNGGATWVNSGSTGAKTDTLSMTTKISYSGLQFKCVVKDAKGNTVSSDVVTLTVK